MIDFPTPTTVGQKFVAPNGVTYEWNGKGWAVVAGSSGGGSSAVTSVNTKTGDVVLGYADVGAAAASHTHTLPAATVAALGGVFATANPGGQFVNGVNASGQLTYGTPAGYTLPVATTTTIGGVKTNTAVADRFVTSFDATGTPVLAQVQASGIAAGPSFAAYQTNSTITTANVAQKMIINSVEDNTGNCYSAATGRFTPTVPGWYIASLGMQENATTQYFYVAIYKTGAQEITGGCNVITGQSSIMSSCCSVVKMNGTTDYLEAYAACGATTTFNNLRPAVYFTATYVRPL